MSGFNKRNLITLVAVFAAMIFGMVLAGGLGLTPGGQTSPEPFPPAPEATEVTAFSGSGLPSFADLAERVSPAVVTIEASSFERTRGGRISDPFEFFFGPRQREQEEPEDEEFRSDSGGSGFLVSADGLVVTNNHVIRGAEQVRVRMGDTAYEAEIKGIDSATDLALLKIDAGKNLPFLPLGDSDALRPGDWVMAIGSPLELADTVTVGVVSAKGRRINISPETTSFESFIQTDAAINFGNSGGPLVDLSGRVVGINTAINWGSENIGFAVPVNILRQILPQLRDEGRVRRGYLGIGVNDLNERAVEAFGLESTNGALVSNVIPGLPADKAGLQAGDIILSVDGRRIQNTRELIDYVSSQGPEAKVELEILRDGKKLEKTVQTAERPSESGEAEVEGEADEPGIEWLGLRYQDVTPGMRSTHGLPDDVTGVWVTDISPRSPLYDEGVRAGQVINVITEVNGRPIQNVEEFEELVRSAPSGTRMRFYLRRFGRGQELQPVFVFPAVP